MTPTMPFIAELEVVEFDEETKMLACFFRRALLVAALCITAGCGGYDVGPDPQAWNSPATASAPPH